MPVKTATEITAEFDAVTRYELAEEILSFLRTDSGRRLRQARKAARPGTDINRLAQVHALYSSLREDVHQRTAAEIEEIISRYGPRARRAAGAVTA